jgi:hypothetical protein
MDGAHDNNIKRERENALGAVSAEGSATRTRPVRRMFATGRYFKLNHTIYPLRFHSWLPDPPPAA